MSAGILLKQRSQTGCLQGTGHAATAFDGVTDAANLIAVALGDGGFKRLVALVQVCDDGRVNFAAPPARASSRGTGPGSPG